MKHKKWSEQELEEIKKEYPYTNNKTLAKKYNVKRWNIQRLAKKFNLKKRTRSVGLIKGNLSKLLLDDPISLYWIGFLMADGTFSKRNALKLALSSKDENHLYKFVNWLDKNINIYRSEKISNKTKKVHKYVIVAIMDHDLVPKIKEKYDISHIKTYIPPNINRFNNMSDDLFIAWFIGFIDGDGNIKNQTNRKDFVIQLCNYNTWDKIYKYIINRLNRICNVNCLAKPLYYPNDLEHADLTRMTIAHNTIIKFLKSKIIDLNLPALNRKWDKINHLSVSYEENRKKTINNYILKIINMRKLGMSRIEMALELDIPIKRLDDYIYKRKLQLLT